METTLDPTATGARRRWTRSEYERAAEVGIFGPDERLELIEGDILQKRTPQNTPHAASVQLVAKALERAFPTSCSVRWQLPLALDEYSEPEPDVAVVAGTIRDYLLSHPTTAALVVEVADTTLHVDRVRKVPLYARAGIEEYWIVNLPARVLEVHRHPMPAAEQPLGHQYRSLERLSENDIVAPLAAPDCPIRVADLLP